MISRIRSAFLLTAMLALGACGPAISHTAATSSSPPTAARSSPQCSAEDLSQWQAQGMAPTMSMQLSPSCGVLQGAATLTFSQPGQLVLVRQIPTPGFAVASLHAVVELQSATVSGEIWQNGQRLGQVANGGAVDVSANIDQAGTVEYRLILRAAGKGSASVRDVKIDVKKRG